MDRGRWGRRIRSRARGRTALPVVSGVCPIQGPPSVPAGSRRPAGPLSGDSRAHSSIGKSPRLRTGLFLVRVQGGPLAWMGDPLRGPAVTRGDPQRSPKPPGPPPGPPCPPREGEERATSSIREQIAFLEELSSIDVDLRRIEEHLDHGTTKGLSGMQTEVKSLEERGKADRDTVAAMDKTPGRGSSAEVRQMTQPDRALPREARALPQRARVQRRPARGGGAAQAPPRPGGGARSAEHGRRGRQERHRRHREEAAGHLRRALRLRRRHHHQHGRASTAEKEKRVAPTRAAGDRPPPRGPLPPLRSRSAPKPARRHRQDPRRHLPRLSPLRPAHDVPEDAAPGGVRAVPQLPPHPLLRAARKLLVPAAARGA